MYPCALVGGGLTSEQSPGKVIVTFRPYLKDFMYRNVIYSLIKQWFLYNHISAHTGEKRLDSRDASLQACQCSDQFKFH